MIGINSLWQQSVQEGAAVSKDTLIAMLDDRRYAASLAKAEAQMRPAGRAN
ncbi:MAG: biotin/lipoyl-binding protein [Stellaceae bacterium]